MIEKRCLECGFFCDLIRELNKEGEKIVQCCSCRVEINEHLVKEEDLWENLSKALDQSICFNWCPTCSDTAGREWEYRIGKLRKEDQQ